MDSLYLFVLLCVVDSYRYGLKAKTLHIPVQKLEEKLGERTRIIEADISQTFDFSNERSHTFVLLSWWLIIKKNF
jgi:hypothetical protein